MNICYNCYRLLQNIIAVTILEKLNVTACYVNCNSDFYAGSHFLEIKFPVVNKF